MTVAKIFWVALGGALGSVMRAAVSYWIPTEFPWATILVNVVGSFVIGLVLALADSGSDFHLTIKLFIVIGFCGAFTTFSTFSYQTVMLLSQGKYGQAFLNIILSLVLALFALWLGIRSIGVFSI